MINKFEFKRRIYSINAFYDLLSDTIAHFGDIRRAHSSRRVSKAFNERIMLAVTEVNGCRYCGYYHTSAALKAGMSEGEIQDMLGGDLNSAPADESVALLFAQHYAETEGHPEKEAYQRLLETYGPETATDILAAIRVIMVGNVYGIMVEAPKNRLMLKPFPTSSLGQEIGIVFGLFAFIPVIVVRQFPGHGTSAGGPTV